MFAFAKIFYILELLFWLDFKKKNPKQNCGGTCVESVLFSKKFYQNNKLWMCTYTLVKFLEQQTVKLYINRWWWRSGTCDSIFEIHSERKKNYEEKMIWFSFLLMFQVIDSIYYSLYDIYLGMWNLNIYFKELKKLDIRWSLLYHFHKFDSKLLIKKYRIKNMYAILN